MEEAKVEAEDVSRWFGNLVAVNAVSFSLGPGITGLLGPNGAGKSTLLNMLSGFLKPSSGRVTVLGEPSWRNPTLYARVGIVPERDALYPFLSAWEFVLMNARLQRLPDPEAASARAIQAVNLEDSQHRRLGGYSKGMRQRAKIAAGIVHDPEVLLLDEPFNGTDPRQRLELMDTLREMAADGKTIIFSSHILEEVERLAQNVLVIVSGRLAAAGDFRHIRRLMTDRPHTFTVRSDDNRRLASALVQDDAVFGVELVDGALSVRSSDFATFTLRIPQVAQESGIRLLEVVPADESLESVFSYLVKR